MDRETRRTNLVELTIGKYCQGYLQIMRQGSKTGIAFNLSQYLILISICYVTFLYVSLEPTSLLSNTANWANRL